MREHHAPCCWTLATLLVAVAIDGTQITPSRSVSLVREYGAQGATNCYFVNLISAARRCREWAASASPTISTTAVRCSQRTTHPPQPESRALTRRRLLHALSGVVGWPLPCSCLRRAPFRGGEQLGRSDCRRPLRPARIAPCRRRSIAATAAPTRRGPSARHCGRPEISADAACWAAARQLGSTLKFGTPSTAASARLPAIAAPIKPPPSAALIKNNIGALP